MEFLYAALPFLACGAMALVCGRMMMRRPGPDSGSRTHEELAELRAGRRAPRGGSQ